MGVEIERKFLLKSAKIVDLLEEDGLSLERNEITQIYTVIEPQKEVRLRKTNDKYIMTTKEGEGLKREEKNQKTSEKLFKIAKKNKIGEVIKKLRYNFKLQHLPCCVDVYKSFDELCVMEIEFPDEQTALNYTLPELFKNHIIKEVTDDESYKNKNLALFGSPTLKRDMKSVFEDIKDDFEYEFLKELPNGVKLYDGMRAIFYSLYEKILYFQDSYLESKNSEDLHQFRVNIRKTRSLLQCVDGVLEDSIKNRFIISFKTIANATNQKRDLDVFKEYLEGLDEIEAEEILNIIDDGEDEDVEIMLKSQSYARVVGEWGVVIQDEDGFFMGENAQKPLKKIASQSLQKRIKRMEKQLRKLNEFTELTHFHKIRIEFKRLRYLSEFFANFFEDDGVENMMAVSKKMQNLFGLLQDKDVAKGILKGYEEDDEYMSDVAIMHACEVIDEILIDEIYELRTKILLGKDRLFGVLAECSKQLKIYM